ncbi:ATP-binding protein [Wenyingzhuangia aestuarii]|uniref:ATP-binding protein n=1 Tax=Wenyingzhuangia aestuarii TaxID=1647582 RepID=UPI00143C140F|nr:ATP-binding protein [Wenyingzhuangia aestuarii]NJB83134.1 ATP-dependent DNA helicase RecG [Wenyingzhuangia aestuarii]
MKEQHNIEFKQKWHDDYLKTIVAFSNTHGGVLYVGKNDDGNVVGLEESKKLLESIPQKIQNSLGFLCEVNLLSEGDLSFIEIIASASEIPISLRGRYYYRSGSTTKEMVGAQLNEFLLKKSGKTWDSIEEPKATLDHISTNALVAFKEDAKQIARIPNTDKLTDKELLEKLRLYTIDGSLTRAAIVLFGKDPNIFYPNLKIKVGRFGKNDATLVHEDVIEGNLIEAIAKTISVLETKYLIRKISYQGVDRIETGEYPSIAIRESLLNALVHRNYFNPMVHISVYNHKIVFYNQGNLPNGFSVLSLKEKHASVLKNPMIADICHKAGYIESWGTGTLKIFNSCKEAQLPEPVFEEKDGGVYVTIFKSNQEGTQDSNQEGNAGDDVKQKFSSLLDNIHAESSQNITFLNKYSSEVLKIFQESFHITSEKLQESFGKASEKQLPNTVLTLILVFVVPGIKAEEMGAILGVSDRTIQSYLKKLKENNFINRVGGRKEGFWEVKKQK